MGHVCRLVSFVRHVPACRSMDTRRRRRATHDTHKSLLDYMGRVDAGKCCAVGDGMKSQGQQDYEADLKRRPNYHNGKPRVAWSKLDQLARWTWEKRKELRG